MLGFNYKREPIGEPFASQIRDSLRRAYTGEMTEYEKECEERLRKASEKYDFVWQ